MEKSAKSSAINNGLYLGLGLSLLMVVVWAVNMNLFIEWWFGIILFIVVLTIGFMSATKSKKLQGGFISFKDAFTSFFLTILIGTLISSIVGFVIFEFVDPEGAVKLNEEIMVVTKQRMESFGVPSDAIKEQLAKMEGQNQFSIGNQLTQYAMGLVIYCIFGLIGAAIIKKKNPDQA